jgi:hypothetical protein
MKVRDEVRDIIEDSVYSIVHDALRMYFIHYVKKRLDPSVDRKIRIHVHNVVWDPIWHEALYSVSEQPKNQKVLRGML